MKIFKVCLCFFVLLSCVFANTRNAYADYLSPDDKVVEGYVKIEGWENVSDYILVQPSSSTWSYCSTFKGYGDYPLDFVLINDGKMCDFGFYSHCSSYNGVVAIPKKYLSDIRISSYYSEDSRLNRYTIKCSSEAYRNSIFSDREIPHGTPIVTKENPIQRIDYVVTLRGIDLVSNDILFDVSEPLNRMSVSDEEAVLFENNIGITQVIEVPPYDGISETRALLWKLNKATEDLEMCETGNPIPVDQDSEINPPENPVKASPVYSVVYFAGLSLCIFTGALGFLVGRVFSMKPLTSSGHDD